MYKWLMLYNKCFTVMMSPVSDNAGRVQHVLTDITKTMWFLMKYYLVADEQKESYSQKEMLLWLIGNFQHHQHIATYIDHTIPTHPSMYERVDKNILFFSLESKIVKYASMMSPWRRSLSLNLLYIHTVWQWWAGHLRRKPPEEQRAGIGWIKYDPFSILSSIDL